MNISYNHALQMTIITQLVKEFLIPGSVTLLLFGFLGGLILLHLNDVARQWGKRWLTALAILYYFLSTPFIADRLAQGLYHGYSQVTDATQLREATAIVVLSGGSANYRARGHNLNVPSGASALRALEAAHVYTLLDNNPLIILSGGIPDTRYQLSPEAEAMSNVLIEIDIPDDRIVLEPRSQNTYEQAVNVSELLEEHGVAEFVLVTSPTHMRRAQSAFAAQGWEAIPAIAPLSSDVLPRRIFPALPSTHALFGSHSAMREYLAITYYWARGWLG